MTADWGTKPTIVGEHVTLRPFRPGDAELMQACFDEEAIRLTGSAHGTAEARRIVDAGLEDRTRDWYATRNDQTDDSFLGFAAQASIRVWIRVVHATWLGLLNGPASVSCPSPVPRRGNAPRRADRRRSCAGCAASARR